MRSQIYRWIRPGWYFVHGDAQKRHQGDEDVMSRNEARDYVRNGYVVEVPGVEVPQISMMPRDRQEFDV